MKKIKFCIISSIIVFAFTSIGHYIYEWFQNDITRIFFPINESIFEHMKLLFSSSTFYFIVLGIYNLFTKKYSNIFGSWFITSVLNIIIFLIIWLPFYFIFGEILIVTLIILLISIFISQLINYFIITRDKKSLN